MNIFWLSLNLVLCVQYHCDKHVVKMILEYAQLLCTAHQVLDGIDSKFYKITHVNHPCSVWVRKSDTNYKILYELFCLLCKEYTYRYNKIHKTEEKLLNILKELPKNIPLGDFTSPPICITNKSIKIKIDDHKFKLVASYRNYYKIEKKAFAVWTKREIPEWFT